MARGTVLPGLGWCPFSGRESRGVGCAASGKIGERAASDSYVGLGEVHRGFAQGECQRGHLAGGERAVVGGDGDGGCRWWWSVVVIVVVMVVVGSGGDGGGGGWSNKLF